MRYTNAHIAQQEKKRKRETLTRRVLEEVVELGRTEFLPLE